MIISDDELSAWLQGDLSPEEMDRIEAACATDPALAARVERMGAIDDLMRRAIPLEDTVPDALLARLGLNEAPAAPVISLAAEREKRRPVRAVWRIAAQVAIVVGLGTVGARWYMTSDGPVDRAEYRALGDAAAPVPTDAPNALVMFRAGTPASAVAGIVASAGGRIVASPTATGVYRVVVAPGRRAPMIDALRQRPEVSMAEPIDGGTQ